MAKFMRRARKMLRIIKDTMQKMLSSGFKAERFCPICKKKAQIFWPAGINLRSNAQCPRCHCMERHRALWLYLEKHEIFSREQITLLHFAAEKGLHQQFSAKANVDYWPVDVDPKLPGIRKTLSITNIPFEDESMDLIICNHVMEHIPDERKALTELYRVLKKDGIAIINAPVSEQLEHTFENPDYNTPELRLKYFGQEDHVRLYGRDYADRLASVFKVQVIEPAKSLSEEEVIRYGVLRNEKIFVCTK